MGSFETTVTSLVTARISAKNDNFKMFALMEKGKETGRIVVADAFFCRDDKGNLPATPGESDVSQKAHDDEYLKITLRGVQLENVEMTGKSDPFFEFSRKIEQKIGSVQLTVLRSTYIKNDLNPKWEPAVINLNKLCDGDREQSVTVSVFDHEKSGKHKKMGSFEATVNDLLLATARDEPNDISKSFVLIRKGRRVGRVVVTEASIDKVTAASSAADDSEIAESVTSASDDTQVDDDDVTESPPPAERFSFVDYVSGGCELQMCIAIDFGESNGDPHVPGTLHYVHDDGTPNDYEKAIAAVGSILTKYDSDQRFPVLGFGARFCGKLQNCFQVGPNAEAQGIEGILESYREMFESSICMSSPSVITEVIEKAASNSTIAQENACSIGKQCYTILLILTNGSVDYVDATEKAIAAASVAPLSIVIVGIGDADFEGMQRLDDFAQGQKGSVRDITQFVEFRAHQHDKNSLTRATLEEIPDQLVEYFHSRGITPNPVLSRNELQIVPDEYKEGTDINLDLNFTADGKIAVAKTTKLSHIVNRVRNVFDVSSQVQAITSSQISSPDESEKKKKLIDVNRSILNLLSSNSQVQQPQFDCDPEILSKNATCSQVTLPSIFEKNEKPIDNDHLICGWQGCLRRSMSESGKLSEKISSSLLLLDKSDDDSSQSHKPQFESVPGKLYENTTSSQSSPDISEKDEKPISIDRPARNQRAGLRRSVSDSGRLFGKIGSSQISSPDESEQVGGPIRIGRFIRNRLGGPSQIPPEISVKNEKPTHIGRAIRFRRGGLRRSVSDSGKLFEKINSSQISSLDESEQVGGPIRIGRFIRNRLSGPSEISVKNEKPTRMGKAIRFRRGGLRRSVSDSGKLFEKIN